MGVKAQEYMMKRKKEIENKITELWKEADIIEEHVRIGGKLHVYHKRFFLVELYSENTETLGCLEWLAEISRWFKVKPLKQDELDVLEREGMI